MTRNHVPETETTIYFLDIRAHGKGFDDYVDRARHAFGVISVDPWFPRFPGSRK